MPLDLQLVRFVLNGLAATVMHFVVLSLCLEVIGISSAGVSNTLAACSGTVTSFLGNRYFVFEARQAAGLSQFGRFVLLYLSLAVLQGLLLFGWTDVAGLDYRVGFLIGLAIHTVSAFLLGRNWVFR